MAYAPQQKVIEVVEYIDDDDYDGDDSDYEEVVEIVEQVVTVPKKFFSPVAAYEVGIGAPPPAFLTPKEKAKFVEQDLLSSAGVTVHTSTTTSTTTITAGPSRAIATNGSTPISPTKTSPRSKVARPSKRLSTKRHLSIVNNALGLPDDHELSDYEEEIIEEEIIEEEYYDEEEIIEEEYYEEEYIEEVIEETEEEAKERRQLEEEIAAIERQMEEAKQAKEKRLAEGGEGETSKEKAQRMAHNSRLQACKQMKVESDFKRKAAARAKILAEKEQNWGVKGKKKQKDLMEVIAAKAKKQKKLLSRQRSKDYTKQPMVRKEAPKVEEMPAEEEEPAESKKPLSLSDMLVKKKTQGIGGAHVGKVKAPVAQNLRAADDFGDDDLRAEDFLPSDSEEEEEEEKVLSPEEEHKKRLEWEKPAWTQAKLKTTVKGTQVKKGKTLAAPITNIPKKINEGLEDDDDVNQPSAGALVKGAIAIVQLPKVKKHQANLKFTGNGARIRDGRKIEKQINPKVSQKEEVKIWGADPEDLKLTPRGLTARKGKGLSDDNITQATQIKKYQFEKPDWAKTKPSHLLKATETGEHLKEGEDIAPKITEATTQKKYEFEKPTWTKAKLKSTDKGSKLKSGEYLSKPIVDLGRKTMNVNLEANPAFLRMTDNGEKLLEGETNLAAPITEAPQLAKRG